MHWWLQVSSWILQNDDCGKGRRSVVRHLFDGQVVLDNGFIELPLLVKVVRLRKKEN